MKWLAEINLGVVIERLGSFKSALFLSILIGLCLFTGYRLGNYYEHFQLVSLAQQKSRLDHLYQREADNIERIHILEVELAIEQLANQQAQKLLKSASEQQFEVKKQLAFYEKVMAPEKKASGFLVENIKITSTKIPNQYYFQVSLVQQKLIRRYSKGRIELVIKGNIENKPVKYKLSEVSKVKKKDLKFSFQYFQIIGGEFTLPEGFTPESVIASAMLTKSRWQKQSTKHMELAWKVSK
jgi:hypothetical protein